MDGVQDSVEIAPLMQSAKLSGCEFLLNHFPLLLSPAVSCSMLCLSLLDGAQKEDLVANLKLALSVPNIPEITQTLLNLAEFMEHCEEASVSGALTEWALVESALIGCVH